MRPITLESFAALSAPAARKSESGLRPRLRRWLRKWRQYGRIEVDLGGLLQLGVLMVVSAVLCAHQPLLAPAGTDTVIATAMVEEAAVAIGALLVVRTSD